MDSPSPRIIDELPVEVVPLESLRAADSPRLSGQDEEHIEILAQTARLNLPPILVHRPTMRVIDGMHRVRAAQLRGEQEIEVSFFDGDEQDAFVLAVQMNVTHGMPLTLTDRTAAAARILDFQPSRSDREIAQATGLAARTVAELRRRTTDDSTHSNTRLGRDGRMRPLNTAEGRRRAADLLIRNPKASLREIAKDAGIAPSTVRDVRERLADGRDPVPPRQRSRGEAGKRDLKQPKPAARPCRVGPPNEVLERLRKDPALRSSEGGRSLLKWLAAQAVGARKWSRYIEHLPPHSKPLMAEMAHALAQTWDDVANELQSRVENDGE